MNRLLIRTGACALSAAVGFALAAHAADQTALLVVGPVEAVIPQQQAAVILGQRVLLKASDALTVGETAAVFGTLGANGTVVASQVRHQGAYVAGATTVLLTGIVQKSEASVGHAQVGGLAVDLTPAMSSGSVSAAIGSVVQVVGIQPGFGGVVLANGISGSGMAAAHGISGSGMAANGISGSGLATLGISGSGRAVSQGISGSGMAASGISGSGHAVSQGISGSGMAANGISGSGLATLGISGSGRAVSQGISGSGMAANGISGSGHAVSQGISGSGMAASGISGSGRVTTHGISGSGL